MRVLVVDDALAHAEMVVDFCGRAATGRKPSFAPRPSTTRALGWLPVTTIGKTIFEFIHPDDMDLATSGFALDGH